MLSESFTVPALLESYRIDAKKGSADFRGTISSSIGNVFPVVGRNSFLSVLTDPNKYQTFQLSVRHFHFFTIFLRSDKPKLVPFFYIYLGFPGTITRSKSWNSDIRLESIEKKTLPSFFDVPEKSFLWIYESYECRKKVKYTLNNFNAITRNDSFVNLNCQSSFDVRRFGVSFSKQLT